MIDNDTLELVYNELRNIKHMSDRINDIRRNIEMIDNTLMNVKSPTWDGVGATVSQEKKEENRLKLYEKKDNCINALNAINAYQKALCRIISKCSAKVNTYLTQLCIFGESHATARKVAKMESSEGANVRAKKIVFRKLTVILKPDELNNILELKKKADRYR